MSEPKTVKHDNLGGLVEMYFHSTTSDGNINWQGQVIARPEPGWFLVQTFEMMTGAHSACYLLPIEKMEDWLFYQDGDGMVHSFQHGIAASRMARARAGADDA